MIEETCLVVLSGGQDSATCAAWAAACFKKLSFISFDYGQRHKKELESAKKIANLFDGDHEIIEIPALKGNVTSGLTNKDIDVNQVDEKSGLPKSFVPGRNLIFLTTAASVAISRGINQIVTGVCQTDFSGYPDCRESTVKALEVAIQLGNENLLKPGYFNILTPLMYLTKKETVRLAGELPRGMEAVALSWTCYEGGETPCGVCPACKLRAKGFEEAGVKDPALF